MSPDRVRFAMFRHAAVASMDGDRDRAVEIVKDVRFYEDELSRVLGQEVQRLLDL